MANVFNRATADSGAGKCIPASDLEAAAQQLIQGYQVSQASELKQLDFDWKEENRRLVEEERYMAEQQSAIQEEMEKQSNGQQLGRIATSGFVRTANDPRVMVATRPSEVFDRYSIAVLKVINNTDYDRGIKLMAELFDFADAARTAIRNTPVNLTELDELVGRLDNINRSLWACEDAVRSALPNVADDPSTYLSWATQIPVRNDERNKVKKAIDALFGLNDSEQKIYTRDSQ